MPSQTIILDKAIEKIEKIRSADPDTIAVVSDFDRTFTEFNVDGKNAKSLFSFLRDYSYISKDYNKKAHQLFEKYHKYEFSPDKKLRYKKMEEWWTEHEKLLVKSGLNKSHINLIIKNHDIRLRKYLTEFLRLLHNKSIPLLVFSSGLGNLIEGFLKKYNLFFDNMHIIANHFNFDSKGNATAYNGKMIHLMNKGEIAIENTKLSDIIKKKQNIILIGDSLGDSDMVNAHDNKTTILKIAFLDKDIEKNINVYKQHYDVILTDNSSFHFILNLLKDATNSKKNKTTF